MRVLMVNKYYRMVGGVERYVKELTRLLEDRGHQVIPFAMADPENDPTPYSDFFVTPIEFFEGQGQRRPAPWRIAERVVYSREARHKMARLIEETQPDVAHLHNIYHHISPSILHALHRRDVPVLMTLHDYKLICPAYKLWVRGDVCERCRGGRFYRCIFNRCSHNSLPASLLSAVEAYAHRLMRIYDLVDLFISPSQFLREKHIGHGLAPERIVHIPNFLVLDNYQPCFDHQGYFVYAGRLTPFKGVRTLLQATAQLRSPPPLFIAGEGPSKGRLEAESRRLGLKDVHFRGHLSGDALSELIARAMFVVVPSEWYENCPYAVLEAFALGTPVVATAIGGIPELVKVGVNGTLAPPGAPQALAESLRWMLSDESALSGMARAGRKLVEDVHSEPRHISALSRAYTAAGAPAL